ncbi:MAG: ribonuclease P protein component [Clostridia bacterium]|nr:ribonuclease P protein component [Clostridia bacterium]
MLNKCYRLTMRNQFSYVYKKGESYPAKSLILIYVKSKYNGLKVGFSVSKKIGNSVVRNKIKRRLREAFRAKLKNIQSGYNYIIIARPSIVDSSYDELVKTIEYVFKKSGKYLENK